jgi:hypothetical protein
METFGKKVDLWPKEIFGKKVAHKEAFGKKVAHIWRPLEKRQHKREKGAFAKKA